MNWRATQFGARNAGVKMWPARILGSLSGREASAWIGYKMIAFGCRLTRPALVAAAGART